jgi:CheY-like chemotaxis protein
MTTRILLAEDEPSIAKLIEFKLSKEGFTLALARDGGEAVTLLDAESWNLAILDVMMPVKTGWQVLKELRSRPRLASIPVIMLSGKADHTEHSGLDAARTIRLGKPFDPESLVRTVRGLLDQETSGDADLAALKAEFLDTFPSRKAELVAAAAKLSGADSLEGMLGVHVVVHKLAGAAATYGLRELGSLAEALDDLLSAELMRDAPLELDRLPERVTAVTRALEECHSTRGDAKRAASTPEARRLISDAGSLPSEASS